MLRIYIASSLLFFAVQAQAQQKDTALHEVKVKARHKPSGDTRLNDFASGQEIKAIDTSLLKQYSTQSIAALLSQQMPVFVKAYSFNGLATLGFRGASAAQSQVFWNGVPIQNAALGIADISTLPALFVSRANVVYGGSGALFGSGNVGGALMLESDRPVFDSGQRAFSVSGGAGSFGQYMGGLKGAVANKKWYLSANVFAQTATNNYLYQNAAGSKTNMPNSNLQSGAITAHAAHKPNERNTIELWGWAQQYDRRIPPALFEPYSLKHQQDKSLRTMASWQYIHGKRMVYAKASLINDRYNYEDPAVQLSSAASVYQYYQEVGWKQQVTDNSTLLLFVPVQRAWLPVPDGGAHAQNKAAIAGAYNLLFFRQRIEVSVQARGEQINDIGIFLPGAGASFNAAEWLRLRANVQRTYRMPTLNELYYFPGGNPRLKPEQGWSQDAGYTIALQQGRLTINHEATVFNRNIRDWITWLGGAIWTPYNIATVHSRGAETDSKITYTVGGKQFHIAAATSYVLATATDSYLPGDGSIGKQIPYTPRYNARINAGITLRKLHLSYNHTYTGYRFTTTDESAWLEPYSTGNILAAYNTTLYSHRLELNGQCNNVWNTRYSVAGFRPMPGINWLCGFRLHF